jgi:hypothetical protein
MATNTTPVFPPVRRDPRQVPNTLKRTINFNDADIAAASFANSLPQGAVITDVIVEVVTAFNAGTTNTLTVGTVSAAYNNMVASADLPGNGSASLTVGATKVMRGVGRALTAAADITPFAKYAQTGAAATAGQAIITIVYEGGWAS